MKPDRIRVRFHSKRKGDYRVMRLLTGLVSPTYRHVTVEKDGQVYDFGPDGLDVKDVLAEDWYPPVVVLESPRRVHFTPIRWRFNWLFFSCVSFVSHGLGLRDAGGIVTPDRLYRRLRREGWTAI